MATPGLPPTWGKATRGHPIEPVREGQRRRWPWLLVTVTLVLLACLVSVGLPAVVSCR